MRINARKFIIKAESNLIGGKKMEKPVVGIVMGSDSDLPVVKEAALILEQFSIPFEMRIISAHRTPEKAARLYDLAPQLFESFIFS